MSSAAAGSSGVVGASTGGRGGVVTVSAPVGGPEGASLGRHGTLKIQIRNYDKERATNLCVYHQYYPG